ncbi:hypothetical protein GJ496_002489 [Pomphorhynchus laevis]|nr:hypothetical protein GJ496_002489 [Pomphorhynchus laevis]
MKLYVSVNIYKLNRLISSPLEKELSKTLAVCQFNLTFQATLTEVYSNLLNKYKTKILNRIGPRILTERMSLGKYKDIKLLNEIHAIITILHHQAYDDVALQLYPRSADPTWSTGLHGTLTLYTENPNVRIKLVNQHSAQPGNNRYLVPVSWGFTDYEDSSQHTEYEHNLFPIANRSEPLIHNLISDNPIMVESNNYEGEFKFGPNSEEYEDIEDENFYLEASDSLLSDNDNSTLRCLTDNHTLARQYRIIFGTAASISVISLIVLFASIFTLFKYNYTKYNTRQSDKEHEINGFNNRRTRSCLV